MAADSASTPGTEYEFEIGTVSIKAITNIPGHPEIVDLTYGAFVDPLGKPAAGRMYPYFTKDYIYPYASLSTQIYSSVLAFFFSRDVFVRTMEQHILNTGGKTIELNDGYGYDVAAVAKEVEAAAEAAAAAEPTGNTYADEADAEADADAEHTKIALQNISIMMRLLFPTSFPFSANNISSYVSCMLSGHTQPAMFIGAFSYLSLFGGQNTVTRTVWLDDCINHPMYQKAVAEYTRLQEWCVTQKKSNAFISTQRKRLIDDAIKALIADKNGLVETNKDFMQPDNERRSANIYDETAMIKFILNDIDVLVSIARHVEPPSEKPDDEIHADPLVTDAVELAKNVADRVWTGINKAAVVAAAIADKAAEAEAVKRKAYMPNVGENYSNYLEVVNRIIERKSRLRQASLTPEIERFLIDLRRNIVDYRMILHVNERYLSGQITPGFEIDEELYPPSSAATTILPAYEIIGLQRRGAYPQYAQYLKSLFELVQAVDVSGAPPNSIPRIVNQFIREPDEISKPAFNDAFTAASKLMLGETTSVDDPSSMLVGVERRLRGATDGVDYEIYVRVDVIGGTVTAANLGQVSCRYKDESLGAYIASRNSIDSAVIVKPNVYVKI